MSGTSREPPRCRRRHDDCFVREAAAPPAPDALLVLGERSSAMSGPLTVALRVTASELRVHRGLLASAQPEREQAPTASSNTAACPGIATLLLNAWSLVVALPARVTGEPPGRSNGVTAAMRPVVVAPTRKREVFHAIGEQAVEVETVRPLRRRVPERSPTTPNLRACWCCPHSSAAMSSPGWSVRTAWRL